jgi:Tfp pilus assembly major pilin PilA
MPPGVPLVTPPDSVGASSSCTSSSRSNEDETLSSSDEEQRQQVILVDGAARKRCADRVAAMEALLSAMADHAAAKTRAAAAATSSINDDSNTIKRVKTCNGRDSGSFGAVVVAGLKRSDSDLDEDDDAFDSAIEYDSSFDTAVEYESAFHQDVAAPAVAAPAVAAAAASRFDSGTADDPIAVFSTRPGSSRFSCQQFIELWNKGADDLGLDDTTELEGMPMIRTANNAVPQKDSCEQSSAQYGRILFPATQRIFVHILKIRPTDVYVDFGSGIGNTVFQAAMTMRCGISKGVEMVDSRHAASCMFKLKLEELAEEYAQEFEEYQDKKPGRVFLKKGRLEGRAVRRFLTSPGKITKGFCNNFNGVLGYRASRPGVKDSYNIDDYVGALFALMEEGSILVTLYPLQLGPSRTQVNAVRAQAGLPESANASFYDMEDVVLGQAKDVVSWSAQGTCTDLIHLYVYKRVEQEHNPAMLSVLNDDDDGEEEENDVEKIRNKAVFICSNVFKCENARNGTLLPATKFYEHTPPGRKKPIQRVVINTCACGYTARMVRRRRKINYAAPNFGRDSACSGYCQPPKR